MPDLKKAKMRSVRKEGQAKGERARNHKNAHPTDRLLVNPEALDSVQTGKLNKGAKAKVHSLVQGAKVDDKCSPYHYEADMKKVGVIWNRLSSFIVNHSLTITLRRSR